MNITTATVLSTLSATALFLYTYNYDCVEWSCKIIMGFEAREILCIFLRSLLIYKQWIIKLTGHCCACRLYNLMKKPANKVATNSEVHVILWCRVLTANGYIFYLTPVKKVAWNLYSNLFIINSNCLDIPLQFLCDHSVILPNNHVTATSGSAILVQRNC